MLYGSIYYLIYIGVIYYLYIVSLYYISILYRQCCIYILYVNVVSIYILYPLAELNQCVLDPAYRLVANVVDVL